jgi:osmotically inducible protein OsmC
MIRRAKAFWYGTGRAGSGHLSSDSGVLAETPYSFRTRFEFTPTELSTEAAGTIEQEGQGFRISRSALPLRAKVPNLDEGAFVRLAGEAEKMPGVQGAQHHDHIGRQAGPVSAHAGSKML